MRFASRLSHEGGERLLEGFPNVERGVPASPEEREANARELWCQMLDETKAQIVRTVPIVERRPRSWPGWKRRRPSRLLV
jgi:hypothetical protein